MLEPLEERTLLSVWYVDDDAVGYEDGSAAYPFDTIQEGINAAASSDTVQVAAGTYNERLTWNAKEISLIGAGPSVTIVDANGAGRCLTILDVPGTASLEGFTLTDGSDMFGGGMYLAHSSPTIENCTITANASWSSGGGIYLNESSPTLIGNTISANSNGPNRDGGGMFATHCSPTLIANTFTGNVSQRGGGGVFLDHASATLTNNNINDNTANSGAGVSMVNASNPLLEGNTISENTASGHGGGVLMDGGVPTLVANTINDNTADGDGGAIYMWNRSLPLLDANSISGNSAVGGGGGMYVTDSSPTLNANMVSHNTSGKDGGGICATNHSNPTLTDNQLTDNFAAYGGGAIFLDASSGTYTRNEIRTNHADKDGGGLAGFNGSAPKLDANTLIGNDATRAGGAVYLWNAYGVLTNNVMAANTSSAGGAVCLDNAGPTLTNDTITANTTGGVWYRGGWRVPVITNCILWGNTGGDDLAGASATYSDVGTGNTAGTGNISADPKFSDTVIHDYYLRNDSPCIDAGDDAAPSLPTTDKDGNPRIGGGIVDMGAYEFYGTTWYVDDNAPGDPGPDDPSVSDPAEDGSSAHPYDEIQEALDAAANGDVVLVQAGTYRERLTWDAKDISLIGAGAAVTTVDAQANSGDPGRCLTIINNVPATARLEGFTFTGGWAQAGGLGDQGGGILIDGAAPSVQNNIITGNYAEAYGGGIYMRNAPADVTGNTVSDNTAGESGGGIRVNTSSATLSNNTITGNAASKDGGGVYISGSSVTLTGNIIGADPHDPESQGNSAGANGGGVYVSGSSMTLTANTIADNSATGWAGGLFVDNVTLTLTANQITGNSAGSNAGALSLARSTATLTGNTFTGNSAAGWHGGAVYAYWGSTVELTANLLTGNSAGRYGGAVDLWNSSGTLTNNTISGNSGPWYGGGVWVAGGSSATLSLNTITGNTSDRGGGVSVYQASAELTDNQITGNTGTDGGGVHVSGSSEESSAVALTGNTIAGNIATGLGGGLLADYASGTVTGNLFENNSADAGGGMRLSRSPDLTVENNTITGNTAVGKGGGGIDVWSSSSTFRNNVISGNAGGWGGGMAISASAPLLDANQITNNSTLYSSGGVSLYNSGGSLTGNTITGNTKEGILCQGSSPTIDGNVITSSTGDGIVLLVIYNSGGDPAQAALDLLSEPTIVANTIEANGPWAVRCEDTAAANAASLEADNTLGAHGSGHVLQRWYGLVQVVHYDMTPAVGASVSLFNNDGDTSPDYGSPFTSGADGYAPGSADPMDSRTWRRIIEFQVGNDGVRTTMTPQSIYAELGDAYAWADHSWNGRYQIAQVRLNTPPVANDDAYDADEDTVLAVPAPGILDNDYDVDSPGVTTGSTLNYDADGESDLVWQSSPDVSQNRWDFTGAGVTLDTGVSSLPGITQAYTFTGAGGASNRGLNDLPGDPSDNAASWEFWIKPDPGSDVDRIFETGGSGDGMSIVYDGSTNQIVFTVDDNDVQRQVSGGSSLLDTSEFHHVVAVYHKDFNGTQDVIRLYIDGVLVDDSDPATTIGLEDGLDVATSGLNDWDGGNTSTLAVIGTSLAESTPGNSNYEGQIAKFRFYEWALTGGQVTVNYIAIAEELVVTEVNGDPANVGVSVTLVSGATLIGKPDGSFTYDPNGQFEYLAVGESTTDSFTYTAEDDDGGTDTATVTITINGVNDAPIAGDDSAVTDEDLPVTVDVLNNDTDVDLSDLLSITSVTDGSHGTAAIHDGGTPLDPTDDKIVYTPNTDFDGADTFSYLIDDGHGGTDTATVTLTVRNLVDLSGRVFDDRDNDGVYDPVDGDNGIDGGIMELVDESTSSVVDTATTPGGGLYDFQNVLAGTYTIREAPAPAGYLDGLESTGVLGGDTVDNADSDVITGIVITGPGTQADSDGYDFAELQPASMQGLVWEDFDDDGEVDLGEIAIDGTTITVTGTDDRGPVSLTQLTDSQGIFEIVDLRPGTYAITETQPTAVDAVPTDFVDGQDVLGEVIELSPGGVIGHDGTIDAAGDKFSNIVLVAGSSGINYNFGERVDGGQLSTGQTATIGFWQNKNGQALIKSLNGDESSTLLAGWLADTFPNMYRTYFTAGVDDNTDVADTYKLLFKRNGKTSPGGPPKLDAQVMAVAMATYLTKESLVSLSYNPDDPANPTTDPSLIAGVESYGFDVTIGGVGSCYFNISGYQAAFGADDDVQEMQIIDLLLATDRMSLDGLLYDDADADGLGDGQIDDFEKLLRTLANDVYSAINEQGHV